MGFTSIRIPSWSRAKGTHPLKHLGPPSVNNLVEIRESPRACQ